MESRAKGTMILRSGGDFYKVLKLRRQGENSYVFECKDLEMRKSRVFNFKMRGLLEVLNEAFKVMKSPKDIFFLDLDNKGKWEIINEDQLQKL